MVKQTVEHFGRVDVLFANAGIAHDALPISCRWTTGKERLILI